MARSLKRPISPSVAATGRQRRKLVRERMQRFSWDKVPLASRQDRDAAREKLDALVRSAARAQGDGAGPIELERLIAAAYLSIETIVADEMLAIINLRLHYGVRRQSFPHMVLVKMALGHLRPENRLSEIAARVKEEIKAMTQEREKAQKL